MKDLEADSGEAREEEQGKDIRIDQRVEDPREEAEVHIVDLGAGEAKCVATRFRLHAVRLLEQGRQSRCDRVDDVHPQRLGSSCVRGHPHCPVGPLDIAPMTLRERAQSGGLVVDQLAPKIGADVASAGVDRSRGADVRLWRHAQEVGRLCDPDPRGAGGSAVRPHPNEHRQLCIQLAEHDLVLGLQQPSGRVQNDHGCGVAVIRRTAEVVAKIVLRDGVHVRVEVNRQHAWRGRRSRRSKREERPDEQKSPQTGALQLVRILSGKGVRT
jgi:hypothetical protein